MNSTINTCAATRVALALIVLMLTGCSLGDDSKSAPGVVAPTTAEVAPNACPPMLDVCLVMAAEVRQACPPDAQYDDEADKTACYDVALLQALARYRSCFKDDEIQALLDCVADEYENGGKGGIPENRKNHRSRGERELDND